MYKRQGVDYTGDVKDCSACPLGKSTQKPHPKQADYGVLRPFQHVSVDFRQHCQDSGIKLEFASPNTPQQIGANERAGRTILNIVLCLLADSTLPNFF